MTIFTDGLRQSSAGPAISDVEASLGESLGATVGEAVDALPTVSLYRMGELSAAEGRTIVGADPYGLGTLQLGDASPDVADVPIDVARQRVKDAGLDKALHLPEQPAIKAPALDIMIDRARTRREREATISRGPSGIVPGALSVGTSLLVSAVDPLNVAAAFIPVVGEARYAKLMASAGESVLARAGARAAVGAASGAVGMAALEPIQYAARNQEGQDYTFADALRSVMYGSLLGGVLHSGGGAVADLVRARQGKPVYPFAEGEAFAKPSAGQPAPAMRQTDLGGAGRSATEETPLPGLPTGKSASEAVAVPARAAAAVTPPVQPAGKAQSLVEFIKARGGVDPNDPLAPDLLQSFGGKPPRGLIREGGQSLDRLREGAVEAGYLQDPAAQHGTVTESTINDLLDAVDTEARGTKIYPAGEGAPVDAKAATERNAELQQHFLDQADADMNAALDALGVTKLRKQLKIRATTIMLKEGSRDPIAALDRSLREWGLADEHPALSALDDLPPRMREDALRASIAALHEGKPVQAGEMLAAAARDNPRLAALSAEARQWPDLPEQAHFAGNGDNGPIIDGLQDRWGEAIAWLRQAQAGDAIGVLEHPQVPGRIDLIWGDREHGLAHIDAKHPGDADALPALWGELRIVRADDKFVELQSDKATAVIARDFAGDPKDWLLTFFQRKREGESARPPGGTITSPESYGRTGQSSTSPRDSTVGAGAGDVESAWRDLSQAKPDFDEPAAIEASRAAEKLPQPGSLAPEPSARVAAAEKALAEAEAEYKAQEAYLPDDLKAQVERELAALDVEAKDRAHVIERGAACLAAAVGGAA